MRRLLTDLTAFEATASCVTDFPLTGGPCRCRYDYEPKRVVNEPFRLRKIFGICFLSPWEGTDYVLSGRREARSHRLMANCELANRDARLATDDQFPTAT